jgi:hypothetical protein
MVAWLINRRSCVKSDECPLSKFGTSLRFRGPRWSGSVIKFPNHPRHRVLAENQAVVGIHAQLMPP